MTKHKHLIRAIVDKKTGRFIGFADDDDAYDVADAIKGKVYGERLLYEPDYWIPPATRTRDMRTSRQMRQQIMQGVSLHD